MEATCPLRSTKCCICTSRAAPPTKNTSSGIERGVQNHSEHKFCSSLPEPHNTHPFPPPPQKNTGHTHSTHHCHQKLALTHHQTQNLLIFTTASLLHSQPAAGQLTQTQNGTHTELTKIAKTHHTGSSPPTHSTIH